MKIKAKIAIFFTFITILLWPIGNAVPVKSQGTVQPGLTVAGSSDSAAPGEQVTFHIQMSNAAGVDIANAYLTHVLPPGFSYVPNSAQVTANGSIMQLEPAIDGSALSWGAFNLPAATVGGNNSFGAHTFVQDLCTPHFTNVQLDQAFNLIGEGGYVTQLFYRIDANTTETDSCAVYFVNRAYDLGLNPIIRLQGHFSNGVWQKPDAGANGDYAEVAAGFARFAAGLPLRDGQPLYLTIWNEPNVWIEWSGQANAQEYALFFIAVSNAIRALGEPRLKIMNGPTSPPHGETQQFIRAMLDVPGFVDAFDIWGSHPYPENHPAWYNSHNGTAQFPEAAIDSYLIEEAILAEYGRTGVQFILKETGYGLGNDIYGFEGFATIDDANRTEYITDAFDNYWRNWPEVLAVTPFELGDPHGGWDWLDWIDYGPDPLTDYAYYPQYPAVAALEKPPLETIPSTVEITFQATVGQNVLPGDHTSYLYALVGGGGTGSLGTGSFSTPVTTRVYAQLYKLYLPLVMKNRPPPGSLQLMFPHRQETAALIGNSADGAINPTDYLAKPTAGGRRPALSLSNGSAVALDDTPLSIALDSRVNRVYLAMPGGRLLLVDTNALKISAEIQLGADLLNLLPGAKAGTLYGATQQGDLLLIDATTGETIARSSSPVPPELGREAKKVPPFGGSGGLILDPISGDLFVASPGTQTILRYSQDLRLRDWLVLPDGDIPDQLLLDAADRRLFVSLPGASEILVLDADLWQTLDANRFLHRRAKLIGGPIVDAALNADNTTLAILTALTPKYRGLFTLDADTLALQSLAAGSYAAPLRRANALVPWLNGQLIIPEGRTLYQIQPDTFSVSEIARLTEPIKSNLLDFDTDAGLLVWVEGLMLVVSEK